MMKPLVGISCCSKTFGPNGLPNHAASDFCVRAIRHIAGAIPILLPAIGCDGDCDDLLARLDGILLTGSQSHVAPALYGASCRLAGMSSLDDPGRDATTLPLIRAAIARGTPILAICRGMQELNVALGGTLHQCLASLPGRLTHAAAQPEDAVARATPAHPITLTAGGLLHRLAGTRMLHVNSLHHQGIDRLGQGLRVEALAPDTTIEAISLAGPGFALGLQWHPEFTAASPTSTAIFRAFGDALIHPITEHLAAD